MGEVCVPPGGPACHTLKSATRSMLPFLFRSILCFLRMEWFVFVLFCCLRFTVLHGRQNGTEDPRLIWQPRGFVMVGDLLRKLSKGNDTNRANRKKTAFIRCYPSLIASNRNSQSTGQWQWRPWRRQNQIFLVITVSDIPLAVIVWQVVSLSKVCSKFWSIWFTSNCW